jgi:hypothetical protein
VRWYLERQRADQHKTNSTPSGFAMPRIGMAEPLGVGFVSDKGVLRESADLSRTRLADPRKERFFTTAH